MNIETYRVLILGDFHFGESYRTGGASVLEKHGYAHSTFNLQKFVDSADSVILNLETPLVDPEASPSPFKGKKPYIHWGDPKKTVNELKRLNVEAVSLANNHTIDHGPEGLEATFQTLAEAGIEWFGAGRNQHDARAPYRLELPDRVGGGEIHFHGSFQYRTGYDRDFGSYATEETSGCAPLSVAKVPAPRQDSTREDSLQVAFPHWGPNYVWRGGGQYRLAHRFLNKGFDLVIGHGGHAMQEVHRKQQRWVVYGIGNGMFNSGGRWRRYEEENGILPFSLWGVLEIQRRESGSRRLALKLYPVYSDNRETAYQPGPVTAKDFDRVLNTLATRPTRPWRFDNPAKSTGKDHLGHYLALELGEWPEGARPSRIEALTEGGDPGEWPLRSAGAEIEDKILDLDKHIGASMQVMGAEADGGAAQWLSKSLALIEVGSKRMLAQGYCGHESALGGAIVSDKVLTARLMDDNNVATPKTVLVTSADAAISAATKLSGPVVVKPRSGNKSRGVSTGLIEEQEIREAFAFARKHGSQVIVQQHIEASEELRVMASPHRAVAAISRVLPHVVGDGISSVGQLIEDKNLQRALNPSLKNRSIPTDSLTHRHLKDNGLSLNSVPDFGKSITVRNIAGISVGADAFQSLEELEPQVKKSATSAVAAIPGLGWGGADLIIERHTGKPYVIEINTEAAYGAAVFPTYGEPLDVAGNVWSIRYAATLPEVKDAPVVCPLNGQSLSIVRDRKLSGDRNNVEFRDLFEDSLIRQSYSMERLNSRVRRVTSPEGKEVWLTGNGRTAADRAVVQKVLQSHQATCRVLDVVGIARPRARKIASTDQLARFVEGRVSKVILTPASGPWEGPDAHVLTEQEALMQGPLQNQMWVQARFRGRRVRVVASRERAWVTLANVNQRRIDGDHIAGAGRFAVEAVRAIPELRWAAVDILVRPTFIADGRPNGFLVEGLSSAPTVSVDDHVIAGNFDDFARFVVDISPLP